MIEPTLDGVVLTVYVKPRAFKTEFVGLHGDALKFRVAAPPVSGETNAVLGAYLAELFFISKSLVLVLAGHTKRKKRIEIIGINRSRVRETLNV